MPGTKAPELKVHPLLLKKHKPLKGMKWRVTGVFCSSRRNKKRRLYEFSCYFSEVTTGQFLFCKLAQNNFLKGGCMNCMGLLLDSEVGALIRVMTILYIYLCNCSISSVIAGTEILMSF